MSRTLVALARPLLAAAGVAIAGLAPLHARAADTPLEFVPYGFDTEDHGRIDAEVAFLEVPRRHGQPDGPRMRLRVVRLPATGGDGRAAPVVYLAGGPGGSGVGTARGDRWPVFDRVRSATDVLLFDQRGTGLSEPPPACPHVQHFDDASPLERDTALAALRETAARCVAHWRAAGVDLESYTSAQSAADLEALRRALGVPKISLWGMSYGSHLALATLRLHGDGIERAVLMGVEGPDDTLKLPLRADALLAELALLARAQGFDDLPAMTRQLLDGLRQQPARGRSLMHGGREVAIGAYDAQLAIVNALGRRQTQQMLPLLLHEATGGDYDLLAGLVLAMREQLGGFQAMPLAMELASGQSPHRREVAEAQAQASLFGDALNFPFPMLGDGLGLADLGDAYRAPLESDVPTLFISGSLDGRTPPANADALLPGFPNGVRLLLRGASHDDELWLGHPDTAGRIAGFLAGQPMTDAELEVPPPVFVEGKLALLLGVMGGSQWMVMIVLGFLAAAIAAGGALVWRSYTPAHGP